MKRVLPFLLLATTANAQDLKSSFTLSLQTADVWRGRNLVDDYVAKGTLSVSSGAFSAFINGRMEMTNTNSYPQTPNPSGKITAVRSGAFYAIPIGQNSTIYLGAYVHQYPGTGQHQTTELYYSLEPRNGQGAGIEVYQDIDEVKGVYARAFYNHSFSSGYLQRDETFQEMTVAAWVGYGSSKHNTYYYLADTSVLTDFGTRISTTFDVGGTSVTPWVEFTTLLDPDLLAGTHDRWNLYAGATVSWRF